MLINNKRYPETETWLRDLAYIFSYLGIRYEYSLETNSVLAGFSADRCDFSIVLSASYFLITPLLDKINFR